MTLSCGAVIPNELRGQNQTHSCLLTFEMSVEADTLIAGSVAMHASSNDKFDAPVNSSNPGLTQTPQKNNSPLTSRSDSTVQQNKPTFIKAHRRGASYIPGGYNFSSNNSKVPVAKSRIEELGNAFPAKKIEVASLAIKSAAQRSSVLNVERSISSPLPTVSSYMMRPPAGRWRSTNGIQDADLHRSAFGQYGRPQLSKASQERLRINTVKPIPKPVKQEDTEDNSRRKTVTWCELTEVHEFDHADAQNKKNEPEAVNHNGQAGNSLNPSLNEEHPSSQKHSTDMFVEKNDFEQTVPSLDMDKLEIVTPLHMSKCVDTDSDISLSSPSSEDSMPFTDAPETQDITMTPETNTYRRNSRISRDDVLSRLAELKKNRNEDEITEANNNVAKSTRSESEKPETVATTTSTDVISEVPKVDLVILPEISHPESSSTTWTIPSSDFETTIKASDSSNEIASIADSVVTESFIDSDSLQSDSASVEVIKERPSSYVSNVGKPASARRLDLSEWYKQRKRMERKQREQRLGGSYDFDASYTNDSDANVSKPAMLDENKRRATYTEGISNIIPLNSSRQGGGGFEEQLLEEFDRIAGGQKPKTYRERTRSKVVVASADFEKAGGAEQAVADALQTKANMRTPTPEVFDDTAQSIHSIESTANFAPRPWTERRRSTDLLSQMVPESASRGRLYLKVVAAQDLDFPFPAKDMEARCVLNEGTYEYASPTSRLSRNTEFGHEFKLETHDFLDFTITIHVNTPDRNTTTLSRLLSTQRKGRTDGLSKYINSEDGALAQVRISFQDIMSECKSKICTATFHLVNGWYKDSTSPLLAGRNRTARRPIREKVVGKLLVKLAYLPGVDPKCSAISQKYSLPPSLEACEEALNIRRWHETCWHAGYMSQQGGDLNFWRRRFYKAVGARLYSHTDTNHSLRTIIDLSKAEIMTVGHDIVAHSQEAHVLEMIEQLPSHENDLSPPIRPASVNSSRMSISSENRRNSRLNVDSDSLYCAVKNSMRIIFSNGDHIDFFCDSSAERTQWVDVLKNIVGRVPEWPEWLREGRQVIDF
ncbi:hypothetical protein INT43_001565 [Umbelopsis isabellina]|uniref:PH domain-containing protein n=1 Tax=Mortierella isabellina TaxID=91625 RepID=A0A8H7U9U0_MORIS|nr:hypothetical protein INT43_001565 [Umbelopsis isabellina]